MAPTTMVRGIGVGQSGFINHDAHFLLHDIFTHIHAIISHTHITHAPRVLINVASTYTGNGRLVAFLLPLLYFFA